MTSWPSIRTGLGYIPNSFFWFSDGTEKEVVLIRELYGLDRGEHILHTAHRTTTSTSASRRFFDRLMAVGYEEVIRVKRGGKYDMAMCFRKEFWVKLSLKRLIGRRKSCTIGVEAVI